VLVIPNSRWFNKRPWNVIPYAALILTALLKEEFNFSIVDLNGKNLSLSDCRNEINRLKPDIVLITSGSVEYYKQTHAIAKISKEVYPSAIVIVGGIYATTLPEEAITDENIDWLFMYHAEGRIVEFLKLLINKNKDISSYPGIAYRDNRGIPVIVPPNHYIGDVATMVNPDYSMIECEPYFNQNTLDYQFNSSSLTGFIITSYGCPYNCVFCASRTISGNKIAFRSFEDIIEELEYLVKNMKIKTIIFLDDALLANRQRITSLLTEIILRNYNIQWKAASVSAWHLDDELLDLMKRSGCTQLTISVESGSQRVLKEIIHKPLKLNIIPHIVTQCRRLGIGLGANFVIGLPGETWDEIRITMKFAEECDFDVVHFHIATPLPKTDLFYIAKEKGYLKNNFSFLDPNFFGYCVGHITTEEFTPFELEVLRAFEWDRINFSSPERIERVARLYQSEPDRLNEHRKQTRRNIGIYYEKMDENIFSKSSTKG
jgi:radical SAM superfamily enzyme YgiQ (UPF0313 family)